MRRQQHLTICGNGYCYTARGCGWKSGGFAAEKIVKIFAETGYSRRPVYEENLDKVIGILYQRDFYNAIMRRREHGGHPYLGRYFRSVGKVRIVKTGQMEENASQKQRA